MTTTDPSSNQVPTTTLELIGRARSGRDPMAVDALLGRLLPRVRGLVAVRMGRPLIDCVDTDDIVQECLIETLDRLDRFEARGEHALTCWLAKIAQSRIADAGRAARAKKRGGGRVARRADLGITTLGRLDVHDPARSPSQDAAGPGWDDRLEKHLLAIGEPFRSAVYCRLVLDMSFADIADAGGLASPDAARTTFHRGIGKLRARLDA